jgi:hypothetical protein
LAQCRNRRKLGHAETIAFTIAIALTANAQRIETEELDRHKVLRVETAPNHLSIIELAEPVTEVAPGSSFYKIEWRGNKVFVQPLDPEATINLFIWTASGRLSYELVPANRSCAASMNALYARRIPRYCCQ